LPAEKVTIAIGRQHIHGISQFYAGTKGLAAITGSSGYLEISLKNGDAAAFLKAKVGDELRLE
jgi:S-adenosyl-L-methionine hydrolase (adenosine-forming)